MSFIPKDISKSQLKDRICPKGSNYLQNNFKLVLKKARLLKDNFVIHSLRHTFVTRCVEKNVDIKLLSKWIGHSDIAFTLKVYTHIQNEYEKKEIEKINNMSTNETKRSKKTIKK